MTWKKKIVLHPRVVFVECLLMGLRFQEDLYLALCEVLIGKQWQEWISPSKLASLEGGGFLKIAGNLLKCYFQEIEEKLTQKNFMVVFYFFFVERG
jgi:hypothetical protein